MFLKKVCKNDCVVDKVVILRSWILQERKGQLWERFPSVIRLKIVVSNEKGLKLDVIIVLIGQHVETQSDETESDSRRVK